MSIDASTSRVTGFRIPHETRASNPVSGNAGDLVDGDMKAGDLVEAKGERIEYLYSKDWAPTMDDDVEQAAKQLRAADARGVGLKWYYAEPGAADLAREEFKIRGLGRIVIGVMTPRRRP